MTEKVPSFWMLAWTRSLMNRADRSSSCPPHQMLLDRVWGFSYGDTSTVTVHVRRLREKIEPDPSEPRYVQTVWGVGYRFAP